MKFCDLCNNILIISTKNDILKFICQTCLKEYPASEEDTLMSNVSFQESESLYKSEIYLNVAGGTKVSDTGLDLAVAVALISAHKNIAIPHDMAFVGEVGLLGEIRTVSHIDIRIKEAVKLGFKTVVTAMPEKSQSSVDNVINIKNIPNLIRNIIY